MKHRPDIPTTAEFEKSLTACATLIQRGYTQLIPYYELVEKMLAESRIRDAAMARVKAHLRNKAA